MDPILSEFHANLPQKIDSIVFLSGIWVPFDSATIDQAFKLNDEDSKEYRKMFQASNYAHILETLTNKKQLGNWVLLMR